MATIDENITTLTQIKADIKEAINNKGVEAGDDITVYGDKIREISGGGDDVDYLCFEAIEDSAISMSNFGDNAPNIEYSFDKETWITWDYDNLDLAAGLKLYMRGDNPTGFNFSADNRSSFSMTGKINGSGNINSLLNKNNFDEILDLTQYADFTFYRLFQYCEALVSAPELPALILNTRCYHGLFGFTGITKTPELPATVLADRCYAYMFDTCLSLLDIPDILPVNELKPYCYAGMFKACNIKEAPYLPAKTLVSNCYTDLFYGCVNLQYIKAEFTTTPGSGYTSGWVAGVPSTGCFIKAIDATWTTKGTTGCPTGWTLITSVS